MDIELLRDFIEFSRALSVTRAARTLNQSTSTLSRHLAAMENELGSALFVRDPGGLALTAAGKMTLDAASVIVNEYDRLRTRVGELAASRLEDLRVAYAMDDRTSVDAVARALGELHPKLHGAQVRGAMVRDKPIAQALLQGDVDVAVLFDPARLDPCAVHAVPFSTDRAVAALPAAEGIPDGTPASAADLSGRTLPWPSAARDDYLDRLLDMFEPAGRRPMVRWVDADNMDAFFMRALEPGEMWLFSRAQLLDYGATVPSSFRSSITVHEIAGADATLTRHAAYRRDNPNTAARMLAEQMGRDWERSHAD